jgi:hypothetical protein
VGDSQQTPSGPREWTETGGEYLDHLWRLSLFILGLIIWITLLRFPFLFEPLGPDEGLFLTMGVRVLHGARLYTEIWDNKPIGIVLIYIAIAYFLGISALAVNLASALAVFASSCLVCVIGYHITKTWRAGMIAAFTLPAYMLDLGANGANTETFMMVLQSFSVWLIVRHISRKHTPKEHLRFAFVFGVLQGMLLQMKFPSLFETVALVLVIVTVVWAERREVIIVLWVVLANLVGFVLFTFIEFLYFSMTGGVADLIYANFVSPRYYVRSPFGSAEPLRSIELTARRMSYFVTLICFGFWFAWEQIRKALRGEDWAIISLLCAWTVGALLGATSSGYFRYYYFISLAAPLTLLGALAMDYLLTRRSKRSAYAIIAAVAVLVAYPISEHIRKVPQQVLSEEYRLQQGVAALARSLSHPGSTTFFADLNPGLYALTDTVPATKYPQAIAHVFDIPQAFGVDPAGELDRIFERKPELIIGTWQRIGSDAKYAAIISPLLATKYERVPIQDPFLNERVAVFRLRVDNTNSPER